MVNEENDWHSHIFEPLFSNHSKIMYFQLLKKYFFDMLSLENIISDIEIRYISRPFFHQKWKQKQADVCVLHHKNHVTGAQVSYHISFQTA